RYFGNSVVPGNYLAITRQIARLQSMTRRYPTLTDPYFSEPYIDVDAWREAPVKHRYVHGGFRNTETRFSIHLPPKEEYDGRFFQPLSPMVGNENLAQMAMAMGPVSISFAVASGGYLVESNNGWLNTA